MNRLTLTTLVAMIAITTLASNQQGRYVIETHTVGLPQSAQTQEITFNIDTATGHIWRLSGTNLVQIPVEGMWSSDVVQPETPPTERDLQRSAMVERLEKIIIPEMEFRQASIHDVVEFLQKASVTYDPDKVGIQLVLNAGIPPQPSIPETDDPPHASTNENDTPFLAAEDFFPSSGDDNGIPLITFRAQDIPLLEAIRIVVQVGGLGFRIEDDVIMIVPFYSDDEVMVQRIYDVLPTTLQRIQTYQPELAESNVTPAALEKRWKNFLSDFGIPWPRFSAIRPLPLAGKVIISNTPENLTRTETILGVINTPPQHAGRFRLIPPQKNTAKCLLLLDSDTGSTWKYEILEVEDDSNTIRKDTLTHIPSHLPASATSK